MRKYLVIPVILSGLLLSCTQLQAADAPTKIKPVVILSGRDSAISEPMCERCCSEKELQDVWKKHEGFNSNPKIRCPQVDFGSYMVIALFNGANEFDTSQSSYELKENAESIHLRIHSIITWAVTNQSGFKGCPEQIEIERCYAFIVLPASKKPIVIEDDERNFQKVPRNWKEKNRFPALDKK